MLQILIISGGLAVVIIVITAIVAAAHQRNLKAGSNGSARMLAGSLRDEKLRSTVILNGIEDGVMLIDGDNIIRLFNPSAGRIMGWVPNEAVGLDYHAVMRLVDDRGQDYQEDKNPFAMAFQQKVTIRDNQANGSTESNKQISLSITASPLLDSDGEVTAVLGVFRDISDEKREEAQRADFISTASHEMRTPVAAIEGYLALAMNDKVSKIDTKARGFLEKAHASTQHLGQLFQDLLTSAKAEDGRLTNHPQAVEMSAYLEQLTDSLRFTAQSKGIAVEYVLGAAGSVIDATGDSKVVKPFYYAFVDPDRMREVITNLFDNAVKYSDKGKISLGITGDNDVIQIRISDTGPGISPEDIPHLFQKFYRVDNSSTRTIGGTGLGLFICRKIVELYQGRIWVESTVNKGSTFYINLPRLTNEKAQELQRVAASQPAATVAASLAASYAVNTGAAPTTPQPIQVPTPPLPAPQATITPTAPAPVAPAATGVVK